VIRESIRRIKHGFLVGIFPEGSRTDDGTVAEFKPGFVTLLRRTGAPVYPVGIAGAFECFPRGVLFIRPGRVRVVVGDPIPQAELERLSKRGNESELVATMRERVIECQRAAEAWRGIGTRKAAEQKAVQSAK
jgi:1-acyl-sn-glycerol-3-phosphate acyltransferase